MSDTSALGLTSDDLLRLRTSALGLAVAGDDEDPGRRDPRDAVARLADTASRLLALQGQDWRSARWALGVRTPGTAVEDVHAAFARGAVVRSWPMRGTLHIVPAEDIGWIQSVTNHRVLPGAVKRRAFLGLDDATLDRLVDVSLEALRGGRSRDRDELAAVWNEAGIETRGNWRYHVIWWLCQNGLAVFGPVSEGGEPRLVSAEEWIEHPRELRGDEALAELAARYAGARGAVTTRDFAWWSGLTAREAKQGLAHAAEAGRLVRVALTDSEKPVELWAAPSSLERAAGACQPDWLLLPAFDEHLLGYQDRAPQLAPEHFDRIVPGRNGMFLATIVRSGRVVGTWKRGTRKGQGLVGTPLPGERIDDGLEALQHRAAKWAGFHGFDETPFAFARATEPA